jgi:hypothetical protein
VLSYRAASPCRVSSGGGEGVLIASSKDFSVMMTFQSVGLAEEERLSSVSTSANLSFTDGEDGLGGSSGRHFDSISERYSFDRMSFLQYFFGFYRSSILLFFINQSASIVDVDLDIPSTCHRRWRKLMRAPMLPQ